MMEWFTSLDTGEQIGALTLLVTIVGVLVAIFKKSGRSEPQKSVNQSISGDNISNAVQIGGDNKGELPKK
ncbi:hypothetical protein [Pseudoalteromonas luteoviolacea]|uniref:Uncharacterized protein n=1 Tax=Pseudoalteromonas luteoviolacea (strain 2ta16) TaxID=1353533 RepID=V4HRF7_PSEL2|nr:hypothetical protein [Pseudoalteromonas luteoviolacea]ESP93395.1 hypothetical protein PL2TA16_03248 [Pseudoalteromonas luteoviolacea 2ta16]KZN43870.1 hypothetical protein N483_08090 [Pseudoalteromonas luteoviolacea NCIMB 1944]